MQIAEQAERSIGMAFLTGRRLTFPGFLEAASP
jgi:hypothetical protein